MKGFFAIIQFCPNLDRCEGANIGVALVLPGVYVGVRMSEHNEAPKQRFGVASFDETRLNVAKQAFQQRFLTEAPDWGSPEDLLKFSRREGNHIRLVPPRTVPFEGKASQGMGEHLLGELFNKLVYISVRRRKRPHKPDLQALRMLQLDGVPLEPNVRIYIPNYKQLEFPFAYKNGKMNLIKPEAFPVDTRNAQLKASELAVEAHMIAKYAEGPKDKQMVVVGAFDESASSRLIEEIRFVLKSHESRLVADDEYDDFVQEVREVAHA